MPVIDTDPPIITYRLCRDCLYTGGKDGCLEHCDVIVIVEPNQCQSDMHPQEEDTYE